MYKVDNAIILAAGLSSRFLPLSLEKPKSLWEVKGEILIERQIKQLIEKGVEDITIVVGYMAEKFEYLRESYGVEIVLNKDYYRYNNTSSLMPVLNKINNTYICSSDNYFVNNPFHKEMERSEYPLIFNPNQVGEYYVSLDDDNRIVNVEIGSGQYCMIGHVFFDEEFSKKFKDILSKAYLKEETRLNLWEHLYIKHLDELAMFGKVVDGEEMLEFDSLEELQSFDETYLEFDDSLVLNNIVEVLDCKLSDIKNIKILEGGLTNALFTFLVGKEKYVYRHPGVGTEDYINRVSEYHAHLIAHEKGFDPALLWINEQGDKISHYVDNFRYFDYDNAEDIEAVLKTMKSLHDLKIKTGYEFEVQKEIESFWSKIKDYGIKNFKDIEKIYEVVLNLFEELDYDHSEKTLCHNDIYPTNYLITENGNYLIDWEFAAETHPALDLATFVVCSPYGQEEIKDVLKIYLAKDYSKAKVSEYYKYFAISGFYWLLWALFQESNGQSTGEFLNSYYKYTKLFLSEIGR